MIEKIRSCVDITGDYRDTEIQECIDEALADMERVGVQIWDQSGSALESPQTETLILAAVRHYTRWQFNYEGEAERYRQAYEKLRDALSMFGGME